MHIIHKLSSNFSYSTFTDKCSGRNTIEMACYKNMTEQCGDKAMQSQQPLRSLMSTYIVRLDWELCDSLGDRLRKLNGYR